MSWILTAASSTGTSHERSGIPCQDAYAHHVLGDNTLVIAIADGAGCARHADQGALLAVAAATGAIRGACAARTARGPAFLRTTLLESVRAARETILAKAPGSAREYATTLLLAIVTRKHVGVAQMGDGAIVALQHHDRLVVLSRQQEREYVNEVTFLTADDYERELHVSITPRRGLRGIALMTDGVETLGITRANNAAHAGFFLPLFRQAMTGLDDGALGAFLSSPPVLARTDDDKTIVMGVPL